MLNSLPLDPAIKQKSHIYKVETSNNGKRPIGLLEYRCNGHQIVIWTCIKHPITTTLLGIHGKKIYIDEG
jgi:hypothetical protein